MKKSRKADSNDWIVDLAIELFDYSNNSHAKERLYELLSQPLKRREDIAERQSILKAFGENGQLHNRVPYAKPDFHDVHDFLNHLKVETISGGKRIWLKISTKERMRLSSKLIQTFKLFHSFYIHYFKNLNPAQFPSGYKDEILWMAGFISSLNTEHLQRQFTEHGDVRFSDLVIFHNGIVARIRNESLNRFWDSFYLFEAYLSISMGIARKRFVFPEIDAGDGILNIDGLYHPSLTNPVKNNLRAGSNVLLFTGPNMAGKSTFLKALSVCVYFSQLGLAIPADGARIPIFDCFFSSINKTDDLTKGYSHFMNEVMQLKEVIDKAVAGKTCFAVFDEIFRGTNNEDAINISRLTLNGLTKFKTSLFFISTHLQIAEVESVQNKEVDCYYFESTVKNAQPVFSYVLKNGWSSLKLGEILFTSCGLKELLKK